MTTTGTARVETVTGAVDPSALGRTLPHEHILFESLNWRIEPSTPAKRRAAEGPVTLANRWELSRDPLISVDNLRFFDEDVAVDELVAFRDAGGTTIVDVTPNAMGRDVAAVRRISERSGVLVVAGTGHYVQSSHTPDVAERSVESLAAEMVAELVEGIGDTGVRAGVIGELGVSDGIHPDERKVLQAGARAQAETGAAITIHCPIPRAKDGLAIVDVLREAGADIGRCVLGHLSHTAYDLEYQRRLADTGAVLQYDRFGAEFLYESWGRYREPNDDLVVATIAALVADGHAERIMLSHDACYRLQLATYGGAGYAHVIEHVGPALAAAGVPAAALEQMLVATPARVFAIAGRT